MTAFLERFFHIKERGSSISKEILGGITTFLALFYILPVNSGILSGIKFADGINQTEFGAIFLATALASGLTTLLMGIFANFPIALSSSMGINAFLAFTVCQQAGFSYGEAMALTIVTGILFFVISVTPLREKIINAIPKNLKIAIASGIGFFICFIGLKNSGIIVNNSSTFVALGDFRKLPVIMALVGMILVLFLGHLKNKKISQFAVIISLFIMGIICATIGQISYAIGGEELLTKIDMPMFYNSDFSYSALGSFKDVFGLAFKEGFQVFTKPEGYAILFALLFVNFFDTTGTIVAVGSEANMMDENGNVIGAKRALMVDSFGTSLGGVFGTTGISSFVESTAGISAGARTGFSSVIVAALFFLSIGIYPVLAMFGFTPSGLAPVTSLALFYVGTLMFQGLKNLDWSDTISTASGFITIIFMLLAYSISDGIAFGFVSYTVMSLASGNGKKVSPLMYIISLLFIGYYILKMVVLTA
jgi:adenine/guanine/hypoxanthine permease